MPLIMESQMANFLSLCWLTLLFQPPCAHSTEPSMSKFSGHLSERRTFLLQYVYTAEYKSAKCPRKQAKAIMSHLMGKDNH